jgi:hypothetical protein
MAERAAMLAPAIGRPRLALRPLTRPATRPASEHAFDWNTPIDRTRWFYCETLTPLYYTPIYRALAPEHRLRYNQLTGMLSNELILLLETGFLDAVLQAVDSARHVDHDGLVTAVRRFREDERRHAETWRRLNQLSAPAWYANTDRYLVRIPPGAIGLSRITSRHPLMFPFVFWIQLAQEERSVDISRRCLRLPPGMLEPRYAAVYRAHLGDEARHVQLDSCLLDRFHASQSRPARRLTAAIFRFVVEALFLKPLYSTVRVIEVLASEFPELTPLIPRMRDELGRLGGDADYQEMMYSRRTTPVTFSLFDRFPEFHCMRQVLQSYEPAIVFGGSS